MPFTSFKTAINAPADRLWAMMVEKVRHPDRFVPGVISVEVVREFSELSIERRMVVKDGAGEKTVHELINADPVTLTVIFKLKDDPAYTGYVINMIFEEDGAVELEYALNWTQKDPAAQIQGPDWPAAIKGAVLHAKALAEQGV